ncbi:hypothetical protein ACH4T9_20975 [Micromonospora sp. NPDC020750]|uniref:hypothetical protein n=1 Tax=Micromonospora sp. NPDC020750 TaxID=3364239 RepID=UPI0037B5E256
MRQALLSVEHPITVIGWLRKSESARLLARLTRSGEPITHGLLDELPPTRHVYYIRDVLVHTGVLDPRNEYLERIGPWLDALLAEYPASHVRLVRPFANWYVLRRARRRARTRVFTAQSGARARSLIRNTLAFLSCLGAQGKSLSDANQADVDRWLLTGSTARYEIRYFVRWAADHNLCPRLEVPLRPGAKESSMLGEDQRWRQLKRCLKEQALPAEVRAAGALVSLYGLTISAIVRLTRDHLLQRDDGAYLAIEKVPVLLPPALGNLLTSLGGDARSASAVGRSVQGTEWLFPGRAPGRHISPHYMSGKLLAAGIEARPTRNAALFALAEDLPAAILADLLGMHVTTAERWAKLARRDWADYLHARTVN